MAKKPKKREITNRLSRHSIFDFDESTPDEMIEFFKQLKENAESKGYYHSYVTSEVDHYDGGERLVHYGRRLETDEEFTKRTTYEAESAARLKAKKEKYDAANAARKEKREYEQFLKLKEKYGDMM